MNYLANSAKTVSVRVAMFALRGVDKGIKNCSNMVFHPVKTAGDFVDSVAVCTKYVSLAALEIGYLDAKIEMGTCSDAVRAVTLEQGFEEAVALGVESLFLHGVGKFCSFVNKQVPTIVKDVAEGVKASEVAMTAEGVPVRVVADSLAECMSSAKKGAVKKGGAVEARTLADVQAARSVSKMSDFFEKWEFGKLLKQYCRKTNRQYDGAAIYEII